jgi:hypothetical protein
MTAVGTGLVRISPARASDQTVTGVRVVAVHDVADAPFSYAAAYCANLNADLCNAGQYYALRQAGTISTAVWSNSHSDNDGGFVNLACGSVGDNATPSTAYGLKAMVIA